MDSPTTIRQQCGFCGFSVEVTHDLVSTTRTLVDRAFAAHECLLRAGPDDVSRETSHLPPSPSEIGPWELAQALFYAGRRPATPYAWDRMTSRIQGQWRDVADAARAILLDGADPQSYLQPPALTKDEA